MAEMSKDCALDIDQGSEMACVVCFEISTKALTCPVNGHTFCDLCITLWLAAAKKCPICNIPCKKEDFLPLTR